MLEGGASGHPEPYRQARGQGLGPWPQILAKIRAGREQRLEARMLLLMSFTVATLVLFWLSTVWIEVQLGDLARETVAAGAELPARYVGLLRIWFTRGILAFAGVLCIVWLTLSRPNIDIWLVP